MTKSDTRAALKGEAEALYALARGLKARTDGLGIQPSLADLDRVGQCAEDLRATGAAVAALVEQAKKETEERESDPVLPGIVERRESERRARLTTKREGGRDG